MTTSAAEGDLYGTESWVEGPMLGFDLETTGVDRFSDVPVSAALVYVEGGKVLRTEYFLIDPGRPIPATASAIHGISTEQAREEGMALDDAVARLSETISQAQVRGCPVVGMNLSYDLTMLDVLARAHLGCGIAGEGLYVLDALVIDRHVDTYRPGKRTLVDLAEHYGVELPDAHNAAADATAACYVVDAEVRQHPDLAATSLADLTAQQASWHQEWAASYSSYRVGHRMSPLEPADFEWPIARSASSSTAPRPSLQVPEVFAVPGAPLDRDPYVADALRADLARRGGERMADVMAAWSKGRVRREELSTSYGRIARFTDRGFYCDVWFQPANGAPAILCVIPDPLVSSIGFARAASELVGAGEVVVVTTDIHAGCPSSPRYGAELLGICPTPVERFYRCAKLHLAGTDLGVMPDEWPPVVILDDLLA